MTLESSTARSIIRNCLHLYSGGVIRFSVRSTDFLFWDFFVVSLCLKNSDRILLEIREDQLQIFKTYIRRIYPSV
jgi:hypothetical protein